MKKTLIATIIITIALIFSISYATETSIPSMTLEELAIMMQARQIKVDIIKKNNTEIEDLKTNLKEKIKEVANKINTMKIEISEDKVTITDEQLEELKNLLAVLQESKTTLEEDVEKISNEIEQILDLISTKGMKLDQYDLLIEKQNEVIVKMKNLMTTIEKI